MDIDKIIDGVKRAILPEIDEIKTQGKVTGARLDEISGRLSDFNQQLIYR